MLAAGGGKTTMMRVLAEELEPTTGDLVKSSKSLRIAFLRQEFVDELDMNRGLKDELLASFTRENALLQVQ
jgi:ATPase subunit of ABC transporter with duplicated ATPase domains